MLKIKSHISSLTSHLSSLTSSSPMFSRFFIKRPIFAIVIAVFMVLVGLITVKSIPITKFPNIQMPNISVSASYPGADAQTVADVIGVPIEEQINGVEDMVYMSSSSTSDGSYNLNITFKEGTNLDMAQVRVQNRVQRAEPQLPNAVKEQGINVIAHSPTQVMFISIQSDSIHNYDGLYLTNYAQLHIVDALERVPGVGEAQAFGAGEYSMRVWLDPDKMQTYGLSSSEVIDKIQSQNMAVSSGIIGEPPAKTPTSFEFTLITQGRLVSPEEFGNIILRTGDENAVLYLKDVARIELGSLSYANTAEVSGHQSAVIGIRQLPGSNALEVAKGVEAEMDKLAPYFPPGVEYNIAMNATDIITASIDDLMVTFILTTLLVMVVIMIFLQNWRAVIIPMLTIPVSLIATFAVIKLLGFTINNLTLFGMLLAIAIVVDDAIVVVEDCSRLIDEGKLTIREAVAQAMKELQGPVVGEVLVLLSVFIPTAFVSGVTGQLYKQFALTIATAVAFSGFNALTFTPAMCALFLKPTKPTRFFFFKWFNKGYGKTLKGYDFIVDKFLKHPVVAIGVYVIITVAAFWGFVKWPTSYLPDEDLGYFITSVQLPAGASLERTNKVLKEVEKVIMDQPEVQDVITISGISFLDGGDASNYGSLYVVLKPWGERKGKEHTAFAVIDRVDKECLAIPGAEVFSVDPPSIPGVGMSSGIEFELLDINNLGAGEMAKAIDQIKAAAAKDSRFASVRSLFQGNVPQYKLNFDRDRIQLLGLTTEDVFASLGNYVGGSFVNDFVDFGRVFQVTLQGDGASRTNPEDILDITVNNSQGEPVPFSSFAELKPILGQSMVNRYNMYNSGAVIMTPAHGVSSDEGLLATEQLIHQAVGDNYDFAWTGMAYQESQSGTTIVIVLIFAVIVTLLVLAAQYESWTDPVAVIISMPTAILGTVLGCIFMSQSISIYTQIGIILLLGMSAKNAILIVEYAKDYRKAGMDIRQAAAAAGNVRFRPIMMTAFAFVFGVMPMMFATGAGAESRISLGTAVVFGMAVNALVGMLFVPNFWALLQHFGEKYLENFFHPKETTPAGTSPSNSDTPASI